MRKIKITPLPFILIFWTVSIYPQSALEVIRKSNDQVQEILSTHTTIDQATENDLFRIIDGVTDFDAISHRVIDRFCSDLTQVQCETFDRVFQRLLRVSSIKKLGRYRAERFEYLTQELKEETATVKTLAYYQDDVVHMNYLLERVNGKWLVFNYVVDDVDTVGNYQKQFVRLFARTSFDEIIARLEKKIAEHEKEY
ncbi:MAG: ABC transporter substrate-binding protein [Candidatus Aminicenantes bacterium]|nr:ABC transporter substrate-binding protein [Candidatus Aminicenantes bacterium]